MTMKNKEGIRCQAVAYSIALPAHLFDGKTIVVNGRERKVENFREPAYHVKDLEITNGDRRIALKGDFTVVIQDNRKFSVPNFSLRLLFAPPSGLVKETKLEFSVSVTPLAVTPLVLEDASAAKVTGSEMAQLLRRHGTNGGDFTVGSVKFRLGDAKKKSGALLRLGAGETAVLPLGGAKASGLYLLQNAAGPGAAPCRHRRLCRRLRSEIRSRARPGVRYGETAPTAAERGAGHFGQHDVRRLLLLVFRAAPRQSEGAEIGKRRHGRLASCRGHAGRGRDPPRIR